MNKKEILNFCTEKKVLLDKDLLDLFSGSENLDSAKMIIEKIRSVTNKNFITKEVLSSNKEDLQNIFFEQKGSKEILRELTIKLGINLEISAKTSNIVEKGEHSDNSSKVKIIHSYDFPGKNFEVKDFVKYFRNRFNEMRSFLQESKNMDNLVSINKLNGSRQNVSIIGIISNKTITKNKNIVLEVEDLTGKVKILINKNKEELYKEAEDICLDSVLCFRCSGNKEILFANELIFPGGNNAIRKKSSVEEYVLFLGDLHYGSKNFLMKSFLKFIDYLNGKVPNTPEVQKIKYLFFVGDIVTGVGNYPNQQKDLIIGDLESQFQSLANILGKIRKDIKIIISPGNHDGVRLMEPQPILDEKYAWPLHEMENVVLVSNPSQVNIGEKKDFEGFNILIYHGFSYPYYANNIPSLISVKAMNSPEKIMEYLLKNRHLAPSHGSVQYFPAEKDVHLIRKIPDIFLSGHTHKGSLVYYKDTLLVSTATWESFTPYQEKFGNLPDYCKVPMFNLKTRAVKILDFEDSEELEEKRKSNLH
jgi:DNA polymerase II small subunit